ncbi:MAG TPA: hypothetical protein VGC99_28845 [Candidatus Tectomicrobia bacterium]
MSNIPYPPDFQIDYHADRHEARRRRALAKIDPEDLLAAVMTDLAEQPLQDHPLGPMLLWLLDQALTPGDGGELWDRLKIVGLTQIERLLDAVLADPTAWED